MTALQVEYLIGPNAGRKLLLRETCITFGRSAERTLPIDLPFISREHGEFTFEDGRWQLVNRSNNGTLLNGKLVTKKPRPIKGPSTVTVGDKDVFRIEPHTADISDTPKIEGPTETTAPTTPTAPPPGQASGSKVKLWAGIGVLWVVALGVIAFVALNKAPTAPASDGLRPILTNEQIRTELTKPPPKSPPDDRRAAQELTRAHELFALIERRPDALYGAYDAYRLALAFSKQDSFADPVDQRRLHVLQQRLVQGVIERYENACNLLRSRQYAAADRAFKDLRAFYPNPASLIFKDALKREAAARDALKKKRR